MATAGERAALEARPTDWIEAEVMKLAGHMAAAMCLFLVMISELDRREAYLASEMRSMAHWIAWKCAVGLSAAREQVRVARALRELPAITERFGLGQLSYSKVRALTRIATRETEVGLVDLARNATAAQLDKVVRTYGRIRHNMDPERARAQLQVRAIHMDHNDDGTGTLTARLPPESLARLEQALEIAMAETPRPVDGPDLSVAARRADALDTILTAFLEPDPDAAPRTEMLVHADLATLVDDADGRGETANATALCAETLRRLACDCGVRLSLESGDRIIDVGERRRSVHPALRRAVESRDDHRCRFPGCGIRHRLRIHHLRHYARGGKTVIVNLILLCPMHHRAVHEGGWTVAGNADEPLVFRDPSVGRSPKSSPTASRRTLASSLEPRSVPG